MTTLIYEDQPFSDRSGILKHTPNCLPVTRMCNYSYDLRSRYITLLVFMTRTWTVFA